MDSMNNSTIENHVTNYMISEKEYSLHALEAMKSIIDVIDHHQQNQEKVPFMSLIEALGQYLVHIDDSIRAKSTGLLSNVIENCDTSKLNQQTVHVLVNFYSSRLSDQTSVPHLMTGLVALTNKFDQFNTPCTKSVLNGLVQEIRVQNFPHITRNATFQVLENLLDHHLEDVKKWNDDYIHLVTTFMHGEKDPRNLMTLYSIVYKIVKLLDISNLVDDLFDATFCYFPITFRPPPDDPYGITAKDLKSSLRKCLSSTPLFAKLGLPLLVQKMSTTSGSAKKDALQTVAACVPVYGADALLPVGGKLLDAVKVEIITGNTDPALREPSLDAIHALIKAMTNQATDVTQDKAAAEVLRQIVDDCIALLDELEEDNVKPASLVLRAAASASPFAYNYIESKVIPMLLRQYRDHVEMKERYLILCTLVAIIQAKKIVFGPETSVDADVNVNHDSVLLSYKERLVDIFSSAIKSSTEFPEVRLMGILGLGLLCVLKDYMSRTERGLNVQSLNDVLKYEEEDRLRMSVEMSLAEIATFDPELITHLTVPALMELLPEFTSTSERKDTVPYKLTLKTVQKVCAAHIIYQETEKRLFEKFVLICGHNQDKKYATEVITALLSLIKTKDTERHPDLKDVANTLLPKLISSITTAFFEHGSSEEAPIISCDEVTQVVYLIFQIIMKNLNTEEQQEYIIEMFQLLGDNDLSTDKVVNNPKFNRTTKDSPEVRSAITQIFSTAVCSIRKGVELPVESTESFLDGLIERIMNNANQTQVTSLSRVVASVINKWKEGEDFKSYVEPLVSRLKTLVEAKSFPALTLYTWVAKALVTRSHKLGLQMTDEIINWIPDPVIGKQSSCNFDVLLGDDPLCLNKQCFATVSLLHKQRFMAAVLPKLLREFHNAHDEDRKLNYLIAIAYLLKNVPKSILINELPPLVPLLVESLSFPDTVLKLSTLDLFQFSLSEATKVMAENIGILLPAFISLIGPNEKSMKVRMAALRCIDFICTKISRDVTLPFAKETLKAIAIALDDKKRLVRKQAVECRESWYLVSQKK